MALSLYAELQQFFAELEQQHHTRVTTPTPSSAAGAAGLVSSPPGSISPAAATEAPSAEGSDKTDKTALTRPSQAGSALAAAGVRDQTATKPRANPAPAAAEDAAPPTSALEIAARGLRPANPPGGLEDVGAPDGEEAVPPGHVGAAPSGQFIGPTPPAEVEDDARPWWERGAEPPCYTCGEPAGNGRDQWGRPLCITCWFDLPQHQQMLAAMPEDEPPTSATLVVNAPKSQEKVP